MEFPPILIVLFIAMVYVVSSIKILAEYERGVIFRLGKLLPRSEGAGRHPGLCANRPHGPSGPAHGGLRRAAAGRDHAGQRLGQGQRGRLLPRDRPAQGGRRSRELQLRDVAAVADDAAQRAGTAGAGRSAVAARTLESAAPADPRSTYRPLGREGVGGRGQERRSASRHAARHGAGRPRPSARNGRRSSMPRENSKPPRSCRRRRM